MYLPSPQFSRLVTILAFDPSDPLLDSMVRAWDHIATRYHKLIAPDRALVGRIESIRLLAVHDAVNSIFEPGNGFVFNEPSTGSTISAALAATAKASHDILANAFDSAAGLDDLRAALEESLSLVPDESEKAVGIATGAASAAALLRTFGPLSAGYHPNEIRIHRNASGGRFFGPADRAEITPGITGWRRSA